MKKEFITYQEAFELRKIGFDEYCSMGYSINKTLDYFPDNKEGKNSEYKIVVCAPSYQIAFRWFIEKHNLFAESSRVEIGLHSGNFNYRFTIKNEKNLFYTKDIIECTTYEEAESACLNKLIEIVKQKK